MTTKVFAYGSISEGMVHFGKLAPFVLEQKTGWVQGSAYRLKVGYPVLMKEGCDLVPGSLLDLKSTEFLLSILDEFFGYNPQDPQKSLYLREETVVTLEGSETTTTAWAYFLNPRKLPETAVYIPGGDWPQDMKQVQLLTNQLTERQRSYIQRLGAASGRDIVPINDMSLYRELMKLELIVDKGRRLALSKLGQEVYRYLE